MKKKKKWMIIAGIVFLAFLAGFLALGKAGSRKDLSQVISYHADGNSIYGAVYDPFLRSYLICQNDYRTGKEYGLRFPAEGAGDESYSLRYLQREAAGNVAALFDVSEKGQPVRSEIWLCTPSRGTAELVYEEEREPGKEPAEMFADSRGILLLQFEDMGKGTDMTRVKRTMLYKDGYEDPVTLGELRLWNMASMAYFASSNEGIWYADRYGNVYHCREDGVTAYILKNDGSRVSINNVGYSITRRGFYFYNLDEEKDYWIGPDGVMTAYEDTVLDQFRAEGYQIEELGIDREGIVYADLGKKEEPWGLAVMVPGKEPLVLWEIGVPGKFWSPVCVLAALLATALALFFLLAAGYVRRSVRVISVPARIAAVAALVLAAGGVLVFLRIQTLFCESRRETAEGILISEAAMEAARVDSFRFQGDQPDVNYFEKRSRDKTELVWQVSGLDREETEQSQMEFELGYFRILGEDAYAVLGYDYVTTPARYTRTEEEMDLISLCMEKEQPVYGTYTEYGRTYLAAYAPVFSPDGELSGLVKTGKALDQVDKRAAVDARRLAGTVILGFVLAAAAVTVMTALALRPLKRLLDFMDRLEAGEDQGRLKVYGHNEISEMLTVFNRMGENIRGYLDRVQNLQRRYSAFVPEELVTLLGKEDIRQVEPGDSAVCEAAVVQIRMDGFGALQAEKQADEMFRLIDAGLAVMLPLVDQAGGQTVRFTEGGVTALFPGNAGKAADCALWILGRLEELRPARYSAAMDYRPVTLKITGSRDRMDFMIPGEDLAVVSGLWELASVCGTGMLASGAAVQKMELECREEGGDSWGLEKDRRELGTVIQGKTGGAVSVSEFFAAWEGSQFRLKRETKELFLSGLTLLSAGKPREARECFAKILRRNGRDMAARRYFDVCDGILTGDRRPEDRFFGQI